jgi:uncharacterized protein (DUF736 family)
VLQCRVRLHAGELGSRWASRTLIPQNRILRVFGALTLVAAGIGTSRCEPRAASSGVSAKARCADIGRAWAARRQSGSQQAGVMLMRPEFAYNKELDTCVCMLGRWDNTSGGSTRECVVWDTLANRPLAEFATSNGQPASALSEPEFDKRASQLMGSEQRCSAVARWVDR